MKLVVSWNAGDGYTCSFDMHVAVEYESAEDLAVDLEEHCKAWKVRQIKWQARARDWNLWRYDEEYRREWITARDTMENSAEFKTTSLIAESFFEDGVYYAPMIRTLDEWWDSQVK